MSCKIFTFQGKASVHASTYRGAPIGGCSEMSAQRATSPKAWAHKRQLQSGQTQQLLFSFLHLSMQPRKDGLVTRWIDPESTADVKPEMPLPLFDGVTYEPTRDQARLSGQMEAVYGLMRDSHWRTLSEIRQELLIPEQSISARLRDFRKARFGGHTVERRNLGDGLFVYRLIVRQK